MLAVVELFHRHQPLSLHLIHLSCHVEINLLEASTGVVRRLRRVNMFHYVQKQLYLRS